jgi:hypothetical protein
VFINKLTSLGGTILHGYFPIYRSFFPRFPSLGQQLFMRTKWCWNMHTNICPNKITQSCRFLYTSTMGCIWDMFDYKKDTFLTEFNDDRKSWRHCNDG